MLLRVGHGLSAGCRWVLRVIGGLLAGFAGSTWVLRVIPHLIFLLSTNYRVFLV